MARLNVSQPLEQQGTQTGRQTYRQEEREQCRRLYKDRVGGRLLSGKESCSTERGRQFGKSVRSTKADSERLGGRDMGRRAGG